MIEVWYGLSLLIAVSLGYYFGSCRESKPDVTPVKKAKVHKSRYNFGNLLDPISPEDQRLEGILEVKKRGGELDGED